MDEKILNSFKMKRKDTKKSELEISDFKYDRKLDKTNVSNY